MTSAAPGRVVVEADAPHVAADASARLARALRESLAAHGSASLALSGGDTPRDTYAALAHAPGVDWSRIDVFWVDERAVPPSDDRSNYRWAKATLLDAAGVPAGRVHRMPADEADLDAASRAYEAAVRAGVRPGEDGAPSFDVMVMGIGDDGHTASIFPGEPTIDVADRLVVSVPARGAREARLTLTRPVIERAARVFYLVVGGAKHAALERAWSAGDARATPARLVAGCRGEVTWIVDRAAAGA